MNSFVYDLPVKVYFGEDQLGNLGKEMERFGKKILLCYGGGSIKKIGLYDKVMEEIKKGGFEVFELSGIAPNPRIESVREGVRICKENKIDLILAVGGGSTIDCAKIISAGAKVDFDPWLFLKPGAEIKETLPLVTILTLAATGSEMDSSAVISNMETKEKLGRTDYALLPKVSFLDPTNTFTVSPYQTASGSSDILSHIFEVYFAREDDLYMLDRFMESLIKTVIKYAPIAMKEPDNYEARANLMWTSSWAINGALDGGKGHSWSCHPMEHELSAFYDITHGHGLAILTPRWLEYSLDDPRRVKKVAEFGVNVFGLEPCDDKLKLAKEAISKLSHFFFEELGLKSSLSQLGIGDEDFSLMAEKAVRGSVIRGFRDLNKEDVEEIYRRSL